MPRPKHKPSSRPAKSKRARSPKKKSTGRPRKPAAPSISIDPRWSQAYREATAKAAEYARDPDRLRKIVEDAGRKIMDVPRLPFKEIWAYLLAMIRLVRAYYNGTYRQIPWQNLVIIVGAMIYFVSPIDFIPDWVPGAGYLDDVFVIGLALKSVRDDLDMFMEWEANSSANP